MSKWLDDVWNGGSRLVPVVNSDNVLTEDKTVSAMIPVLHWDGEYVWVFVKSPQGLPVLTQLRHKNVGKYASMLMAPTGSWQYKAKINPKDYSGPDDMLPLDWEPGSDDGSPTADLKGKSYTWSDGKADLAGEIEGWKKALHLLPPEANLDPDSAHETSNSVEFTGTWKGILPGNDSPTDDEVEITYFKKYKYWSVDYDGDWIWDSTDGYHVDHKDKLTNTGDDSPSEVSTASKPEQDKWLDAEENLPDQLKLYKDTAHDEAGVVTIQGVWSDVPGAQGKVVTVTFIEPDYWDVHKGDELIWDWIWDSTDGYHVDHKDKLTNTGDDSPSEVSTASKPEQDKWLDAEENLPDQLKLYKDTAHDEAGVVTIQGVWSDVPGAQGKVVTVTFIEPDYWDVHKGDELIWDSEDGIDSDYKPWSSYLSSVPSKFKIDKTTAKDVGGYNYRFSGTWDGKEASGSIDLSTGKWLVWLEDGKKTVWPEPEQTSKPDIDWEKDEHKLPKVVVVHGDSIEDDGFNQYKMSGLWGADPVVVRYYSGIRSWSVEPESGPMWFSDAWNGKAKQLPDDASVDLTTVKTTKIGNFKFQGLWKGQKAQMVYLWQSKGWMVTVDGKVVFNLGAYKDDAPSSEPDTASMDWSDLPPEVENLDIKFLKKSGTLVRADAWWRKSDGTSVEVEVVFHTDTGKWSVFDKKGQLVWSDGTYAPGYQNDQEPSWVSHTEYLPVELDFYPATANEKDPGSYYFRGVWDAADKSYDAVVYFHDPSSSWAIWNGEGVLLWDSDSGYQAGVDKVEPSWNKHKDLLPKELELYTSNPTKTDKGYMFSGNLQVGEELVGVAVEYISTSGGDAVWVIRDHEGEVWNSSTGYVKHNVPLWKQHKNKLPVEVSDIDEISVAETPKTFTMDGIWSEVGEDDVSINLFFMKDGSYWEIWDEELDNLIWSSKKDQGTTPQATAKSSVASGASAWDLDALPEEFIPSSNTPRVKKDKFTFDGHWGGKKSRAVYDQSKNLWTVYKGRKKAWTSTEGYLAKAAAPSEPDSDVLKSEDVPELSSLTKVAGAGSSLPGA